VQVTKVGVENSHLHDSSLQAMGLAGVRPVNKYLVAHGTDNAWVAVSNVADIISRVQVALAKLVIQILPVTTNDH
jgi:hypothetical protein